MKRNILLALLPCVLVAIGVLGFKIYRGNAEKDAIAARIQTLPDFRFFALDGAAVGANNFPPDKPLVVMHFLTDCHFCQGETKEITRNRDLMKSAHILMVSMQGAEALRRFSAEYGLDSIPTITVTSDSLRMFGNTFGTINAPVTFIYDRNRRLVKQFTGETSAKAIANVIHDADHAVVGAK